MNNNFLSACRITFVKAIEVIGVVLNFNKLDIN